MKVITNFIIDIFGEENCFRVIERYLEAWQGVAVGTHGEAQRVAIRFQEERCMPRIGQCRDRRRGCAAAIYGDRVHARAAGRSRPDGRKPAPVRSAVRPDCERCSVAGGVVESN